MTWAFQELQRDNESMAIIVLHTRLTGTKGTIPNQLSSDTKRARDTEEDGVKVHLVHAVVG